MPTINLAGCVILKDNKILLVRKDDRDFWELPGGRVNNNDEELTALEKTREQIGAEPDIIQQFTILEYQKDQMNMEAAIFECHLEAEATFNPGSNIAEVKWFDIKKAKEEKIGNDVEAILEEL